MLLSILAGVLIVALTYAPVTVWFICDRRQKRRLFTQIDELLQLESIPTQEHA